jgi:hypothetical protein
MFSAPGLPQNMPDCLQREPIIVLQPTSIQPEARAWWERDNSIKGDSGRYDDILDRE